MRPLNAKKYDEELVHLLTEQGKSIPEIAREVGCTERHVSRLRAKLGISRPHHGRTHPLTQEERTQIEAMIADGAPRIEIARTLGIGRSTLVRHYPEGCLTQEQVRELALAAHKAKQKGVKL